MLVGGIILDFGGEFVVVVVEMEVKNLELEVKDVVRIVSCCVKEELFFLRCLSRKSLKGNMSKVGGCPFGMVMQVSSLMEVFFSDTHCLGRVTGQREGVVVVVGMIVGMVQREVSTNFGCR